VKRTITPEEWSPVGVSSLEQAAEFAVRSETNGVVVAGPGAGKTELLAQRADYLLRIGICAPPRRILAISFKRDAARNLEERVAERLPKEMASRFDSWTFDKFSKQMLDRFRKGLPTCWRPVDNYELSFWIKEQNAGRILENCASALGLGLGDIAHIPRREWYNDVFIGASPLLEDIAEYSDDLEYRLATAFWKGCLVRQPSIINFQMISRLVELQLRMNPAIRNGLRATYAFVFLDEFQDTTNLQYDIVKTAFHDSSTILTAVGDPKQCIMTWAGALDGVMKTFANDFSAKPYILRRNYRSEPELITILGSLAKQIEPDAIEPEHGTGKTSGEGQCRVFEFADDRAEAHAISQLLDYSVKQENIPPREMCILCRKLVANYSQELFRSVEHRAEGYGIRDESSLQDLLAEPITIILSDAITVATGTSESESWSRLQELLAITTPKSKGRRTASRMLSLGIDYLSASLLVTEPEPDTLLEVFQGVLAVFGIERLKQQFPQYIQGDYFDKLMTQFCDNLCTRFVSEASPLDGWRTALQSMIGVNSIPMMTVHKSKGLEYHTVIFMGLEDAAFNNLKDPVGEGNNFFVAFSRAKKRVVFTFSRRRFGSQQRQTNVQLLYDWLAAAGVQIEPADQLDFSNGIPSIQHE